MEAWCYDSAVSDSAWRPSRPTAVVLAVFTAWPIVYFCLARPIYWYLFLWRPGKQAA